MRKIMCAVAAGLALAGVATPAAAADVAPADAPADWSGFYAGVLAGYGWGDSSTRWDSVSALGQSYHFCSDTSENSGAYNGCGAVDVNSGGFAGAIEGGYDLQHGNLVLGAVIGLGYMDIEGSARDTTNPRGRRTDTTMSTDSGFYGSAALRAGVAVGNMLIYGKGGGALYFGESHVDDGCVSGKGCGPGRVHAANDGSRLGWTLGGGAEYRLNQSWTLKVAYDYYDFGTDEVSGKATFDSDRGLTTVTESWDNELTAQTVMAGFDYRF